MTLLDPTDAPSLSPEAAFDTLQVLEREIMRVIVGQHLLIRRLLTGLFAAIPYSYKRDEIRSGCGHLLLEGVPGVAKTLTVDHAGARDLGEVPAHPAHARHAAGRHPRHAHLRRAHGDVPDRAGSRSSRTSCSPTRSTARRRRRRARCSRRCRSARSRSPTHLPARRSVLGAGHAEPGRAGRRLPLPEAQLDRFSMMLRVGYPERSGRSGDAAGATSATSIWSGKSPRPTSRRFATSSARTSTWTTEIREYIVRLGRATRTPGEVGLPALSRGAHPRHLAALLSAHPRAGARHGVPARPRVRAAGGREGDLLRRGAAPHRRGVSARRPRISARTSS